MQAPLIHLNGTGRNELTRQLEEARDAVYTAILKLRDASPNARDYYPLGKEAFKMASLEHQSRLNHLQEVMEELELLFEVICDQP